MSETPGRVLYVAAEGAFGLDQRFTAWEHGYNKRKPISGYRLQVVPVPVNLMKQDEVAALCQLAQGMDLVVIDTLARCLVGADENSAKDIGLAVDSLYKLRDATGDGTVLALHHTGKDKTTIRGSSSLEDGVDTVYKTEGDPRNLKLYRTKRKDGPTDDVLQLRLNTVDGTNSAVLSRAMVDSSAGAEKLLSTFLSTFGGRIASKAELREASGMQGGSFHRALTELVNSGKLIEGGPETRRNYQQLEN